MRLANAVLANATKLSGLASRVSFGHRRALQNARLRASGLGWKAERCPDPAACDAPLCVADDEGRHWHPAEPLAFAKWRVRANPDAMPIDVVVRTPWAKPAVRRRFLLGALGGAALAVGLCMALASAGRSTASA